jgi:SPP1 family predicted phage head-tail adaptor
MMAPPIRFNETADLFRIQLTSDGQGGWTEQYVANGTARCRVRPWTTEENLLARQEGTRVSHIMYVPGSTDVERSDAVRVRGMAAEVMSVREPSVTGHHLMVDLDERQPTWADLPGESS